MKRSLAFVCEGGNEPLKIKRAIPNRDRLSVVFFDVFNGVGYFAIEDKTKLVQRFCRNRRAMLHPVDRVGGHALPVDQLICGNVSPVQRFPKGTIGNHADSLPCFLLS